ncbi:MAG: ATP-binding cassette domain-containing protein [Candidatus Zixiibacteriota bacterium]|nr:MAG: ATP-binding cassette domain-containing protein [candidate division Zixibacteria bacterium]
MVEANGLSMNYGPVVALSGASFKARQGEVMGLLGPNGAGKTTTMKILTTQIVPTSGGGKVAGYDILKDPLEIRRRVGYLPETPPLYGEMEVSEYLDFVGKARGLSDSRLKERIDYVVNACGLREVFKTTVGTLSHGYSQRVGLAQALIHDPEVLILDEPTSGLDPMQIIGIRDLVRSLAHDKTIIFSTHILQEVEAIADRVVIITDGFIVADETLDELQSKVSQAVRFTLTVAASKTELAAMLDGLKEELLLDYNISEKEGFSLARLESSSNGNVWIKLAEKLNSSGWLIKEFKRDKSSMEEAFRYYVKIGSEKKSSGEKVEK